MRVAVLGAGYAGLTVARRLERTLPDTAELVVVDESSSHLVQHELHRVIRHPELADVISIPLEELFSTATVTQGTVLDVDTGGGVATLDTEQGTEELEYDYAAVCLGAETAFYDLDGVERYATPLKRLDHAESIREDAIEAADGEAIVGGGGLSGIQTAGELAALSAENELSLDVTLVEMEQEIAPGFDSTFASAIRGELEARGVTVETGVAIESADEEIVHLTDGRSLPADVFVWTGGICGPAAMDGKRQQVGADLRVSENTFVVGDAADVTDVDGDRVPASAQTAVKEAAVVAANIRKLTDGSQPAESADTSVTIPITEDGSEPATRDVGGADTSLTEFDQADAGWVVSVGDGAVARVGSVVFSGEPAKAAKAAVGAGHLGSVGAISDASTLVAEELGWPTSDPFGIAKLLEDRSPDLGTDPASVSERSDSLLRAINGMSGILGSGQTVDLSGITGETDPSRPGSKANSLKERLFGDAGEGTGSTDTGAVEIEVTDESEIDQPGDHDRSDDADSVDENSQN